VCDRGSKLVRVPCPLTSRRQSAQLMTEYFRREAKFMMAWLILWPIVLIVVTLIVMTFIAFWRG